METLTTIPWQAEKAAFEAIAQIGSYEAMTVEERNQYDDALRIYRDSVAVYRRAHNDGKKEGDHERAVKIASSMLQDGFTPQFIMRYTELSEDEIDKLREKT